jgi:MATE family multidrug resistance protein
MSHPPVALGIVGQAWPILLGQLASMAYGVLDTMMAGHSSPTDLAAIGLGASIYSSVFVSLIGVVGALNPIIAHHYGARRDHAIGASYVQGLWIGLMLSLVGFRGSHSRACGWDMSEPEPTSRRSRGSTCGS